MREPFQPVEFGFRAGVHAGKNFDETWERLFRHDVGNANKAARQVNRRESAFIKISAR